MTIDPLPTEAEHRARLVLLDEQTEPERCPAVSFSDWGIVRCRKDAGHRGEFHAGSGRMLGEDGEPDVFGSAWRYMLAVTA
jgi:hypothetical protein